MCVCLSGWRGGDYPTLLKMHFIPATCFRLSTAQNQFLSTLVPLAAGGDTMMSWHHSHHKQLTWGESEGTLWMHSGVIICLNRIDN